MPRPASRWTNFTNYVGSKICQISKLDNKLSDFVENISKFRHMATLNLFFIFLLHLQNSGQRLPIYHTDQNETMSQKRPKMIQFCIECHPIMYFIFQATQICIPYFRPPTCRPAQEWRKNASANSSHPFHLHHPPIWWEGWYNYDDMEIWNHEYLGTITKCPFLKQYLCYFDQCGKPLTLEIFEVLFQSWNIVIRNVKWAFYKRAHVKWALCLKSEQNL